jgi:hypothetical protein
LGRSRLPTWSALYLEAIVFYINGTPKGWP